MTDLFPYKFTLHQALNQFNNTIQSENLDENIQILL